MQFSTEIISIAGGLLTSFIIVFISIPSIVKVAFKKQLYDAPSERSSHTKITPTLGGVAIFAGILITLALWIKSCNMPELQYIAVSLIIMFFIGIKDDMLIIAPLTKLAGELVAGGILVFVGNIRFTNLHGFNNIHELPYVASVILTLFVIIVIINALNLIDGIDGLASGVGIVVSATLGIWFFLVNEYNYAILAASVAGGLVAFFIYNVYGKENKIFMGDTGSLVLGVLISVLIIKFNEFNINHTFKYWVQAAPSVSFGILIVPLFDTLRVMFIRFFTMKPLFKADKRHLHHALLNLNMSHKQATYTILFVNILFILFVFYVSQFTSIRRLMLLILLMATILNFLPHFFISKLGKKNNNIEKK